MATIMEATRRLTIEATARGVKEAEAAVRGLAGAQDDLTVSSQGTEKATVSAERALDRIQRRYDSSYRAQKELARVERELATARSQGLITETRQAELLDMATAKHTQATAAITKHAAALGSLRAANQNAVGGNNFAATNLAYQAQDIFVTAQMGMSPAMIALQQGSQMGMALSTSLGNAGAAGAARTLGAAMLGLLNPINLVAIAGAGLLAWGLQYAMGTRRNVDDVDKTLKEHEEAIQRVAARWGEAMPALKAYNDESQRTKELADAMAAGRALGNQQYDPLRGGIGNTNIDLADLIVQLRQAGAESDQIVRLQREFGELQSSIQNSSATAKDATDVQMALSALLNSTGIPGIADYASEFEELAKRIADAADKAQTFREEAAMLDFEKSLTPLNRLNVFRSTPFQTEEEIMFERSRRQREEEENRRLGRLVPIPTPRPNDIERLGMGPSGADYIRQQEESLELLKAEIGLLGQSEGARQRQIAVLRVEQEIRRRGLDINGEEAEAMRRNAALQIDLALRLENARQQERKTLQAQAALYQDVFGYAEGQIQKLIQGTATWKDALSSLVPIITNLLRNWQTTGANPLAALFGGAGSQFSPNTTLSGFLSGGVGSLAANQNVSAGGSMSNVAEIAAYIKQAAIARNIDPAIALKVARSEGLAEGVWQANYVKNGYREPSFGPFQLLKGGPGTGFPKGLGNDFMSRTGLDPANPANIRPGIDFALNHAATNGWGAWYGAKKVGVGNFDGLSGATTKAVTSLEQMVTSTTTAAEGLQGFGSGLGTIGSQMANAAAGAASGGGGGLFGWLGGLFGGFSLSPKAAGVIRAGGGGLYANGGISNGPAIFGEAGPEAAVPLPDGRRIPVDMRMPRSPVGFGYGGGGNVTIGDTNITIQGNVDSDTLPEIRDMLRENNKRLKQDVFGAIGENRRRNVRLSA